MSGFGIDSTLGSWNINFRFIIKILIFEGVFSLFVFQQVELIPTGLAFGEFSLGNFQFRNELFISFI